MKRMAATLRCDFFCSDVNLAQEYGPVIIATGGYGADYTENSLLKKYRPDILHLPTTNGFFPFHIAIPSETHSR